MEDEVRSFPTRGDLQEGQELFAHRLAGDTFVLSFKRPAEVVSWAILNGGFRPQTAHIINHHVEVCSPNEAPDRTLRQVAGRLSLKGTVVGMMTAADVRKYSIAKAYHDDLCAWTIATAACGNLATVGEAASFLESRPKLVHADTINLVVVTNYRFTHEAMLEAIEIATEAKVKVLCEFGLRSKANGEPATGTGTDCIAVIGRASLESIRSALRTASPGAFRNSEEAPCG